MKKENCENFCKVQPTCQKINIMCSLFSWPSIHIACVIIRPKRSIASVELWKHCNGQKTVVTRSTIIPPKVNRLG